MPIQLPPVQVVVSTSGGSRTFNGANASGSLAYAQDVTWSSIMPGGFSGMDFRILESVRAGTPGLFRYGANVRATIAPDYANAGEILFEGYLRQPTPSDDKLPTLHAVGYKTLLEERTDPLLWQSRYYGDWQTPDSDDFSDSYHNSQHIDAVAQPGALAFIAQKGTDVADGNKASFLWWGGGNDAAPQHQARRVAFNLFGSDDVGNQASAAWSMHLERYTGPNSAGTATDIYVMWNEMNSKDRSSVDQTIGAGVGGPASVVGITLIKKGPATGGLNHTWRFWIKNLRVNDLASGDSYVASAVVNDLKDRLGFGNAYVSTTSQNILPLWWQEGTWADLMDYLAGSEGNWKWGVWEVGAQGPIIEFRDWNTGNNTWKVWGYTGDSTVPGTPNGIPDIAPSDDVYSMVDVVYKQGGSARLRHSRKAVSPNPFAGLDNPLKTRQRTYVFALNDDQLDNTFPDNVANKLANELGTERYSGTIRCTWARDAATGNDKSSYLIRAGDKVTVPDHPDGSTTFRVYEAQHDPTGSTLTIGRLSMRVERMIWWNEKRKARTGRASSAP